MDAAIMAASERQAHVMLDEQARELYEMRQKAEMDRASELSFATWKGRTEGVEMGRKKRDMEIALNALRKACHLT